MEEIWKEIDEFEGIYKVSNKGRIKSFKFGKEKILKLNNHRGGYLHVGLYKNGIEKSFSVHRLVAQAFIENLDNKPVINHIDNNPVNNNLSNLEWNTQKENSEHRDKQGRGSYGEKNGRSKLTWEKVKEIRLNKNNLSQIELAKKYKVSKPNISDIINYKSWKV